MPIERKLAAIMFTDIVGFTKIMGDDETTALNILENQQRVNGKNILLVYNNN